MKGRIWWLAVASALLLAVACAPKAPIAPAPQTAAPVPKAEVVAPAPKTPAPAAWEEGWEETVTAAKKEGRLMLYLAAGGELRVALAKAFKDRYGITMEVVSARGNELAAKILAERRAGIYSGDVYIGGGTSQISSLKPEGALDPLEPVLMLPEVVDTSLWWQGKHAWIDPEHKVLSFTLYPGTSYAINTTLVKPEEVKSYKDLLNPKWKGKMVMFDPTLSGGPTQKWFVTIAFEAMKLGFMPGMDFMRELAKQEPAIVKDRRQQVEWLAHGKYAIAIAPDTTPTTEMQKAGAPIVYINPVEGNFLTSGYGNVSLLNRAPHPNAARVFINWLLSKEGQITFTSVMPYHSARLDVPTEHITPSKLRQPGVNYFYTETEDYLIKEPERGMVAKDIFGALIK